MVILELENHNKKVVVIKSYGVNCEEYYTTFIYKNGECVEGFPFFSIRTQDAQEKAINKAKELFYK